MTQRRMAAVCCLVGTILMHLNAKGSEAAAKLVVEELRKAVPDLVPWLK